MRAAVLNEVDAPLELRDVPDPEPQEGQALVRVRAAGINFADVMIRRGVYPQMPEMPAILGIEAWFGTLAQCVDAAVTGRWRGELS